ncbi:dihydroxyacetone kinase transcriptional activator DhaS [Companilactobacillus sp.]|jgi:probable dihydroxyacetone kinase regulator|uniref:dihydroxyacetone kinase transcriptional activator DhaS n=1 Tax=Companilactobacillus sp. TaxID=2767905 RepID=UPI0025BC3E28|nr:dihydroxyacetone kinase transcriptional activator DhaS [Companilactobacillus sp.]MCH4009545.1 dihydroxyacetone kinase transcriptional activator DhaS [Companilactobacillus sp.]MCH4052779.1 dihydroxyacetone kinase transcriptional activator DhaS [Companilactobacillus sp.]MCH4077487.1 dihydroxyacetone kinase transcriptional activator DhaS [Companilactobacillus sp.]MCH4126063.1 dihydroxyacetone kinase transcriptional activator DhaS [Companilactobacillus sp.]MCI1311771.1 dihydroxyacetone kinase t
MSYTKKKMIANLTKDLVVENGLDAVSITKIMSSANMRRQTFYDYFLDKYDLLAWLYQDEISEIVSDNLNYEKWVNIVDYLCAYFFNNRKFYKIVLTDSGQNSLDNIIEQQLEEFILTIIDDLKIKNKLRTKAATITFYTSLLANSLLAEIKNWITVENTRTIGDESRLIKMYIEDVINGLLLKVG